MNQNEGPLLGVCARQRASDGRTHPAYCREVFVCSLRFDQLLRFCNGSSATCTLPPGLSPVGIWVRGRLLAMYPLLVGVGVAAAAMTARGALEAAKVVRQNPELLRQANAAAAGFRGMANAFPTLSQLMSAGKGAGFEATMSRREAASILGVRETSSKQQIKEAHRKIMMLNHPDRGGSPFIASKINEASETLQGGRKSSGSAFS